jgi:energy-coupling factor transporter transmembrane protein EcfT
MIPTKLAFVLFCWTSAFFLPTPLQVILMHVVFILGKLFPAYRPHSPTGRRTYVRFLVYAGALTVLIVILNSFFIRSGEILAEVGPLRFWMDGFFFGIRVSARLVLMSTVVLLFFLSTPIRDFASFLESTGTPRVVISVLLLSLEFVDRIPQRIERIFCAQEARGAPVRSGILGRVRSLATILSPLILSSLVESVDRSHSLALRGYLHRSQLPRPARLPLPLKAKLLIGASVVIVIWFCSQWMLP